MAHLSILYRIGGSPSGPELQLLLSLSIDDITSVALTSTLSKMVTNVKLVQSGITVRSSPLIIYKTVKGASNIAKRGATQYSFTIEERKIQTGVSFWVCLATLASSSLSPGTAAAEEDVEQ